MNMMEPVEDLSPTLTPTSTPRLRSRTRKSSTIMQPGAPMNDDNIISSTVKTTGYSATVENESETADSIEERTIRETTTLSNSNSKPLSDAYQYRGEREQQETIPTILTEERATLSHVTPFLSKQRSQWWLPLALAVAFAFILLILRTTMVDTPMLTTTPYSFSNWMRSPFSGSTVQSSSSSTHQSHHLAHTARREDLMGASKDQLDKIVRQLEDDVHEIKESLSQALHREHDHTHTRLHDLNEGFRSTAHRMHDDARKSIGGIKNQMDSHMHETEAKFKSTLEKGKDAADYMKDTYEGGKMYIRDKLHHIPEDFEAARERYSVDRSEMYLRDKIHHLREELRELKEKHFQIRTPSLYERMMNWFGASTHTQSRPYHHVLLTSEPHPLLEPQYLDKLHYDREGQLRQEIEDKLREAKHILRNEHLKSKKTTVWSSLKNALHHGEDAIESDLALLKENHENFNLISPKFREMLKNYNSPHAQALISELESLEKKGKSYAEESKGHLDRIRDSANSIIHNALSTLESAKEKLIEGKNDVLSKFSASSDSESKAIQTSNGSSASESISLLEENIRHVYNLAREQAEHQAKLMGEYGRHSASSMSEWLRHEKEKARIHAHAQDKDMSDRHHGAPGLLFDPLAV